MTIEKVVTLQSEQVARLNELRHDAEYATTMLNKFEATLIRENKPQRPAYGPWDLYDTMKEKITGDGHIVFYYK